MAAVFIATVWHSQRKLAAEGSVRLISEHNARLLTDQRQFLQDAAHQLRTPITIALGHAELLATDLSGEQQGEDIGVVIGELSRLRRISERLLIIAAAGDPAFLHAEYVQLDELITDHVRRWRPTISQRRRLRRSRFAAAARRGAEIPVRLLSIPVAMASSLLEIRLTCLVSPERTLGKPPTLG